MFVGEFLAALAKREEQEKAAKKEADKMSELLARFADAPVNYEYLMEQQRREWLTFWNGSQWGDNAPNRLYGAWLNAEGEAV